MKPVSMLIASIDGAKPKRRRKPRVSELTPEQARARNALARAWSAANKDRVREHRARYYARKKEKCIQRSRRWRDSHPDRVRASLLRCKYGLSLAAFSEMLAAQGGRCAICRCPQVERTFHVDHDHVTSVVRGVLCNNCNLGLGYFKDNHRALIAAAKYIIKHAQQSFASPKVRR